MEMIITIINFIFLPLLLIFTIAVIAGIIEALIKTRNLSNASFEMLRLRKYAISASVAIVGLFLSIVYVQEFGAYRFSAIAFILAIATFYILIIMFLWLMGDALGYQKRFRRVYLLSLVSFVGLAVLWAWLGYVPSDIAL